MATIRFLAVLILPLSALGALLVPSTVPPTEGIVIDREGPVTGATVRWQGSSPCAHTDSRGRFTLPGAPGAAARLTALKKGYRIASALPGRPLLALPLPAKDNDSYEWVDPYPDPRQPNKCGNCHQEIFGEWASSAHARSATNPNFLRLFAGTEGTTPPRKTWNVMEEHPLGAGVCAACHAPTLHDPDLTYDVRKAKGAARLGVHCDYCHKVVDAPVDKLGTRFGRDGLTLLRPAQDDQLFFGPLDDAVRPGESFAYAPVYKESRYCASCHEGVLFGVHVYSTYSEWLASPARAQGQTCQSCHMAPTGVMTNIAPGHGGIERDPRTLASHHVPGATKDMLAKCLHLDVKTQLSAEGWNVTVVLRADNVGHRVPTGFIDRHLVLLVQATEKDERAAPLLAGPRLPAPAGKALADLPGFLYAKRLTDETGRSPAPFWLPPAKVEDTRLEPGRADEQRFRFGPEATKLRVRLWHRRLWPEVGLQAGNEILVVDRTLHLTR